MSRHLARKTVGVIGFAAGKPISNEAERKAAELADRQRDRDPLRLCGVYQALRPFPCCFGSLEEGRAGATPPPSLEAQFRAKKAKRDIPFLNPGTTVHIGPGLTEGQFIGRLSEGGEIVCVLSHRTLYEDFERVDEE